MLTAVDHVIVLLYYYYYYCHCPWQVSSGWALGRGMRNKTTRIWNPRRRITVMPDFSFKLFLTFQTSPNKFLWWKQIDKRQPTPVFLPGKIPWTEEPGELKSMGSQKSRTRLSEYPTTTNLNNSSFWLGRQDISCILEAEFWDVSSAIPVDRGGNWGPG